MSYLPRAYQQARRNSAVPVVDLFAGPGGLGEGFASLTARDGEYPFRIALSVEKDPIAHMTLELRALYRRIASPKPPAEYYAFLKGELSRDGLFSLDPRAANDARSEAWCAELGVTDPKETTARLWQAVRGSEDTILIGGPPCQAYSLVGRSRNAGNPGYNANKDRRHTLYLEYLRVLSEQWPAVFVMENVKGLLSARYDNDLMLRRILEDLQEPARAVLGRASRRNQRYRILALDPESVSQPDFFDVSATDTARLIVRSERFGIPQARHRIILIGVREDITVGQGFGLSRGREVTADEALQDLPSLRSGLSGEEDSRAQWNAFLNGVSRTRWWRALRGSDRGTADAVIAATEAAIRRRTTRGAEFLPSKTAPRVHHRWYADRGLKGVVNHSTRSHRRDDLARYLFAAAFASEHARSPVLSDFPPQLLPTHRSAAQALSGGMFADRFRVQIMGRPATTVTSHISKDGHYYIHYDASQCRSLTVREAARLQTFPDNYFFCGPRTAQFHQVGNAVPPLLARQIATVVAGLLGWTAKTFNS